MAKSLLEELSTIVATAKRQAGQILESLEGRSKVTLHEYRHDFLRRPYLKADGMPAQYSPDFLVRTDDAIYVVETKSQQGLTDENVQRKRRAALTWCERINGLTPAQRDDRDWYYVLLGEQSVRDWVAKNQRAWELLDYARLRMNERTHRSDRCER